MCFPEAFQRQEFAARGWVVHWITVAGQQVGVQVGRLSLPLVHFSIAGCPGMHEVKRERVFLLATRRGFTFPAPRSEFWRVVPAQVSRKFECHECLVIAAQDTQVMPKDAMMDAANLTWTERGFLPLRQWLCFSRSASDDQRLKCLGNIVIPRCAQLGLHQLVHELQGAHRS